jgi:flagellin
MRIKTNMMALDADDNRESMSSDLTASSGYRLHRPADETSSPVIRESLKSQVSGLRHATHDGISVVGTDDDALTSARAILQRIREVLIRTTEAGTSHTTAREVAHSDIMKLRNEIDLIANATSLGNQRLLDSSFGAHEPSASDSRAAANRIEATLSNAEVTRQNLTASESQIADRDKSAAMVDFTKNEILLHAGTARLARANKVPQTILRLLHGSA